MTYWKFEPPSSPEGKQSQRQDKLDKNVSTQRTQDEEKYKINRRVGSRFENHSNGLAGFVIVLLYTDGPLRDVSLRSRNATLVLIKYNLKLLLRLGSLHLIAFNDRYTVDHESASLIFIFFPLRLLSNPVCWPVFICLFSYVRFHYRVLLVKGEVDNESL